MTTVGLLGLGADRTTEALILAGRAPSLHNSQPWAFEVSAETISVHLDLQRLLPGTDPDLREARISCGAALFTLQVALAELGESTRETLAVGGGSLLATVALTGPAGPSTEVRELAAAIRRRATNRRPFADDPVPPDVLHELRAGAHADGCVLTVVDDPAQHASVRRWSNQALQEQNLDPIWLAEWHAWTARDGTDDGVPAAAAGLPGASGDLLHLRDFGPADRLDRPAHREYEHEPNLLILSTWTDLPSSQVAAGRALAHLLLTATARGLSASFLSQLIEVPWARAQLQEIAAPGLQAQVVLRIGYGTPVRPTPRRAWQDTLLPTTDR